MIRYCSTSAGPRGFTRTWGLLGARPCRCVRIRAGSLIFGQGHLDLLSFLRRLGSDGPGRALPRLIRYGQESSGAGGRNRTVQTVLERAGGRLRFSFLRVATRWRPCRPLLPPVRAFPGAVQLAARDRVEAHPDRLEALVLYGNVSPVGSGPWDGRRLSGTRSCRWYGHIGVPRSEALRFAGALRHRSPAEDRWLHSARKISIPVNRPRLRWAPRCWEVYYDNRHIRLLLPASGRANGWFCHREGRTQGHHSKLGAGGSPP